MDSKQQKQDTYKYTILLDKLPLETTEKQISDAISANKFKFNAVEKIGQQDFAKFGIESPLTLMKRGRQLQQANQQQQQALEKVYFLVIFETKADLNALAYNILFEKTIKVTEKKLHLKLHNKKGNYNPETSICIQQLNYACTESQVIEELNIVLRDDRNKKAASNPEDTSASKNFILSCIIFVDPITRASKQFGFVDFNSAEAANICRKAWNEKSMTHYPNRLNVTMFEPAHVKMTKQEREKTKERQVFTNLYVEKLPYAFTQQDVFDLFSKHGTVLDVKMKKPQSNVALQSVNLLPCAAYVNYKDADQAKAAIKALNGYQVIPGANSLRIDYYQRANKFLGGLLGLDMKELLSNTHWRVLFLRGIHTSITRDELGEVLTKFGVVETFTLKTQIVNEKVVSRGICIVQYQSKDDACTAMQRLPFERSLGSFVEVDYYQSKESRLQELERKQNPFQQVLNPMLFNALSLSSVSGSQSPTRGGSGKARKQRVKAANNNNKPSLKNQSASANDAKSSSVKKHNQQSNKASNASPVAKEEPKSKSPKPKTGSTERKAQQTKKDEGSSAVASKVHAGKEQSKSNSKGRKNDSTSANARVAAKKAQQSMPMPPPPQPAAPAKPVGPVALVDIPKEEYAKCETETDKKQFLGNYLYQFASRHIAESEKTNAEELAGKVTGMILEGQSIDYILYLCTDKKSFYTIVGEALNLIKQAEAK